MAAGSVTDLEMAFYAAGGLTGSLSDRRLAYAKLADADVNLLPYSPSVTDARQTWWYAGPGDITNITDLERRYYLGSAVKFTANNSISDLRYERFGGNV